MSKTSIKAEILHTQAEQVFSDCGQSSTFEALNTQSLVDLLVGFSKAKLPVVQAGKAGAAPEGSEWAYYRSLAVAKAGGNAVHISALLGLFFNAEKVKKAGGRDAILERLQARNADPKAKPKNRIADLPRVGKGQVIALKGASHKEVPSPKVDKDGKVQHVDGLDLLIMAIKQLNKRLSVKGFECT